ncbi:cytochrome b/b6 domain-containing protein [Marinobacterium sediminicola]|uniref:Cytochrome b n=1 Tax=Marinobacterium sediminicola TaxID=518898 RepID=A0ABY1RXD7_9GAMM|nr:cytochrome b/b6 domain-containing protein [Marinobacterium sediminicola]ULG67804.1 cytochrome b/b6 domain-containing protein [Marinobacterium sediminicola]SMR71520.1 Cytochrome b [Marinobacterium sediminicola]
MVTVKVWDPFVRFFHWALVFCFTVAWLSADEWQDLHELAGYTAAILVSCRVIWGFVGPRYARFTQFVHHPAKVLEYLKTMWSGHELRYIGHNPAGGLMVVVLLCSLALLTFTGWLGTDILWGESWVEEVHESVANLLLILVLLHLSGVVLASLRHRESLIKAMLTGRKRGPGHADIE